MIAKIVPVKRERGTADEDDEEWGDGPGEAAEDPEVRDGAPHHVEGDALREGEGTVRKGRPEAKDDGPRGRRNQGPAQARARVVRGLLPAEERADDDGEEEREVQGARRDEDEEDGPGVRREGLPGP